MIYFTWDQQCFYSYFLSSFDNKTINYSLNVVVWAPEPKIELLIKTARLIIDRYKFVLSPDPVL